MNQGLDAAHAPSSCAQTDRVSRRAKATCPLGLSPSFLSGKPDDLASWFERRGIIYGIVSLPAYANVEIQALKSVTHQSRGFIRSAVVEVRCRIHWQISTVHPYRPGARSIACAFYGFGPACQFCLACVFCPGPYRGVDTGCGGKKLPLLEIRTREQTDLIPGDG